MEKSRKITCGCFGFLGRKPVKKTDKGTDPEALSNQDFVINSKIRISTYGESLEDHSMTYTQKFQSNFPLSMNNLTPDSKTPRLYQFPDKEIQPKSSIYQPSFALKLIPNSHFFAAKKTVFEENQEKHTADQSKDPIKTQDCRETFLRKTDFEPKNCKIEETKENLLATETSLRLNTKSGSNIWYNKQPISEENKNLDKKTENSIENPGKDREIPNKILVNPIVSNPIQEKTDEKCIPNEKSNDEKEIKEKLIFNELPINNPEVKQNISGLIQENMSKDFITILKKDTETPEKNLIKDLQNKPEPYKNTENIDTNGKVEVIITEFIQLSPSKLFLPLPNLNPKTEAPNEILYENNNSVIVHDSISISNMHSLFYEEKAKITQNLNSVSDFFVPNDNFVCFAEKMSPIITFPKYGKKKLPSLKISPIKSVISVDDYSDIISLIKSPKEYQSFAKKLSVPDLFSKNNRKNKLPALKPITPHFLNKKKSAPLLKNRAKVTIGNI